MQSTGVGLFLGSFDPNCIFFPFTLSTNVIVKGAIDCLKWGREANLGVSTVYHLWSLVCPQSVQMESKALRDTLLTGKR